MPNKLIISGETGEKINVEGGTIGGSRSTKRNRLRRIIDQRRTRLAEHINAQRALKGNPGIKKTLVKGKAIGW